LGVAGVVLLVLSFAFGIVEQAQSYTDSWAQLVWGLGIWVCGVTAAVTGLIAIIRHHERSWMVVLATALGLLPLDLLLSEIATATSELAREPLIAARAAGGKTQLCRSNADLGSQALSVPLGSVDAARGRCRLRW
jgi:hypothetical protein